MSEQARDPALQDRDGAEVDRPIDRINRLRDMVLKWIDRLELARLTREQRLRLLPAAQHDARVLGLFHAGFLGRHPDLARRLGVTPALLEALLRRELDAARLVGIGQALIQVAAADGVPGSGGDA